MTCRHAEPTLSVQPLALALDRSNNDNNIILLQVVVQDGPRVAVTVTVTSPAPRLTHMIAITAIMAAGG